MPKLTPFQQQVSRVDRLERTAQSNFDMMAAEIRRLNRVIAGDLTAERESMIGPGQLGEFVAPHRHHRQGRVPDLGQAGLQRLRDDPMMGYSVAGRSVPFAGTGNLLADPTFERTPVVSTAPTISASYQSYGKFWEAKRTTTGTAPSSLFMFLSPDRRVEPGTGSYASSALMRVQGGYGATTGTFTIYLRPTLPLTPAENPQAPYLVASVRIVSPYATDSLPSANRPASVMAWMEITDAAETVLATGDTVDLNAVLLEQSTQVIHAALPLPSIDGSVDYFWRLVVEVSNTGSASGFVWDVVEPSLSMSENAAAQSFQPAIGAWVPAHYVPAVAWIDIDADEDDWDPGLAGCQIVAANPTAARTITGIRAPLTAYDGMFFLANVSRTNDLILSDQDVLSDAVNRFELPNTANLTIREGGCVLLRWFGESDGQQQRWRVLSQV